MKIDEMIEKGLIRKENIRNEEIIGSLDIAERFLERAKGNFKIKFWDVAFSLAYSSMFHTARSLLFKMGYKERSHFALIEVLKMKYSDQNIKRYLDVLDSYRISRHAIQYKGDFCSEIDASEAIKDAEEFLTYNKKMIRKV